MDPICTPLRHPLLGVLRDHHCSGVHHHAVVPSKGGYRSTMVSLLVGTDVLSNKGCGVLSRVLI